MFTHPDLVVQQAKLHHSDLIAEADRRHLLRLAREWRHAAKAAAADRKSALRTADELARIAPVAATSVTALASTLVSRGRHAAGSAR